MKKANDFFQFNNQSEKTENKFLFIRADYSLIKIAIADILYIEGLDDYIKINLPNRRPVVPRMNLKDILTKLPAKEFIRVHRSFIVPFSKIENVRNKTISIAGAEIPIGKNFEEEFFKLFKI